MISKKNSVLIFEPKSSTSSPGLFPFFKGKALGTRLQKVRLIIHKQTKILLFHLKNMKYSAALPMFLIWCLHVARKLLSFDKMRFFFL